MPFDLIVMIAPFSDTPDISKLSLLVNSGISSNCGGAGGVMSLISTGLSDLATSPTNPANFTSIGIPKKISKITEVIERNI